VARKRARVRVGAASRRMVLLDASGGVDGEILARCAAGGNWGGTTKRGLVRLKVIGDCYGEQAVGGCSWASALVVSKSDLSCATGRTLVKEEYG
jgi:hypothetical protein